MKQPIWGPDRHSTWWRDARTAAHKKLYYQLTDEKDGLRWHSCLLWGGWKFPPKILSARDDRTLENYSEASERGCQRWQRTVKQPIRAAIGDSVKWCADWGRHHWKRTVKRTNWFGIVLGGVLGALPHTRRFKKSKTWRQAALIDLETCDKCWTNDSDAVAEAGGLRRYFWLLWGDTKLPSLVENHCDQCEAAGTCRRL